MRVKPLTRMPERAQDIAPEVKLTFLRNVVDATGDGGMLGDVLTAAIPLFVNKDPRNPAPE